MRYATLGERDARKTYRLKKGAWPPVFEPVLFTDLRKEDRFVLIEEDGCPVALDDGGVVEIALGDPFVHDGIHVIEVESLIVYLLRFSSNCKRVAVNQGG